MSKVLVNPSVAADGCAAGPHQTEERPFGDDGGDGRGNRLHAWMCEQAEENRSEIEQMSGAAAHAMGRDMSGAVRDDWDGHGWWGEDPPFHGPVFVLTHHPRAPRPMECGTTYHFATDGIGSALAPAREAAGDGDIRDREGFSRGKARRFTSWSSRAVGRGTCLARPHATSMIGSTVVGWQ